MQAETILAPAVSFPPASELSRELEAVTPEEEFEAELGEQAVWEGYFDDKGVRS